MVSPLQRDTLILQRQGLAKKKKEKWRMDPKQNYLQLNKKNKTKQKNSRQLLESVNTNPQKAVVVVGGMMTKQNGKIENTNKQ